MGPSRHSGTDAANKRMCYRLRPTPSSSTGNPPRLEDLDRYLPVRALRQSPDSLGCQRSRNRNLAANRIESGFHGGA